VAVPVEVVQAEAQRIQQWHGRCKSLVVPAEAVEPAVARSVPVEVVQVEAEEAAVAVVEAEAQREPQWNGQCQ
jgi:hypothetical protein